MHLVDDEHFVLSDLRRNAHLFNEVADIVDRVVGSSVEFVNVERALFVEREARFAFVAGFTIFAWLQTVDGLGEDACTSGLADASRSAEEVGVCEFAALDGILQRCGYGRLSDHAAESHRTVLARRNDVFRHILWFKVSG